MGESTEGVYEKKNAGELLVLSSSCCYPGETPLIFTLINHDKFHILNIRLILKLLVVFLFKLLMPTGHVMHQQFNIHQLYVLPTLYLFVL